MRRILLAGASLMAITAASADAETWTYNYTGSIQTFAVPTTALLARSMRITASSRVASAREPSSDAADCLRMRDAEGQQGVQACESVGATGSAMRCDAMQSEAVR